MLIHCLSRLHTGYRISFSFPHFVAEYYTLCPGGEGFRPNPITIILEGEYTSDGTRFKQELTLEKSW